MAAAADASHAIDQEQWDAQQQLIEAEQESRPLIGPVVPLPSLEAEYKDNAKFLTKIRAAEGEYPTFRRVRGDGSCFYRGYVFAILEWMSRTLSSEHASAEEKKQIDDLVRTVEGSLAVLTAQGYPAFTMEEFHEYFLEQFTWCRDSQPSSDAIAERMNDEGLSQYLASYARYLTSSYLKAHADDLAPFVPDGKSVDQFIREEIDPPKRECEHLQIVCLTSQLGVGVRLLYLDQSESNGEQMRTYVFPEGATPRVHMLYRPGHYDVLNLKTAK